MSVRSSACRKNEWPGHNVWATRKAGAGRDRANGSVEVDGRYGPSMGVRKVWSSNAFKARCKSKQHKLAGETCAIKAPTHPLFFCGPRGWVRWIPPGSPLLLVLRKFCADFPKVWLAREVLPCWVGVAESGISTGLAMIARSALTSYLFILSSIFKLIQMS